MTVPGQRGDRPAHRVADGKEAPEIQLLRDQDCVICTVRQAETRGTEALPVPAMIHADHPEMLGERPKARPPVEATRRAETVKQYDRWCPGRSGDVTHLRSAAPWKLDLSIDRHDVLVPPRTTLRQSAIERGAPLGGLFPSERASGSSLGWTTPRTRACF